MATGENAGTWGDKTNTNLNLIQQAIAGYQDISIAGGAQTTALTMDNASISNARNAVIKLTGTITGNQVVTIPDGIEKTYIVSNGTVGAFTVQFKTASGTGTTFSTTDKGIIILFVDGTNVVDVNSNLSAITIAENLSVTGTSSFTGVATFASTPVFPSGVGLIPSGGIIMWSGTIASIPSGFLLCDGSSGTPDLRDKFIIGANADSGGAAKTNITGTPSQTGGTKDAIVVSHTHTVGTTNLTGNVISISQTFNEFGSADGIFTKTQGDPAGNTPISSDTNDTGRFSINASHTHTLSTEGSSGTNQNLPPYYALAFIMKT